MKIEIKLNEYELDLQTRSIPMHSLLSDNPELVTKLKETIIEIVTTHVLDKRDTRST